MRFRLAILFCILCICGMAGVTHAQNGGVFKPDDAAETPLQREDLTIVGHDGARHLFHVELALGPLDQERGLMFRHTMPADAGMLFVFPDEAPREFWMKDTLIPLDMLFLGQDGTISHIHANAIPKDLTAVPSNGPALAVLELNGGTAERLGIREGDKAEDKTAFKNAH